MKFLYACQPMASHFAEPYLRYLDVHRIETHNYHHVHGHAPEYDVCWIEWGASHAMRILERKRLRCLTMVRVHDWEIRTGRVRDIPHEHVDVWWFINPQARDDFHSLRPEIPRARSFFLPNAIDFAEWPLCASGERHLGIVTANIQPRKALHQAVDLMRILPEDYQLTIRTSPDPHPQYPTLVRDLMEYAASLPGKRITFEFRNFNPATIVSARQEIIDFWMDKSHAVSVAEHEGFCYGLAEGMACGAAGACLEWDWGRPRTFYSCVQPTLEKLAEQIQRSGPGSDWRAAVEPYAAPALAYKLEETITRLME